MYRSIKLTKRHFSQTAKLSAQFKAQFKKITDFGQVAQSRLSNLFAANQCPETIILVMVPSSVLTLTKNCPDCNSDGLNAIC